MLCSVDLVETDVSEELSASIIRVTRIGELGTLAVTTNRRKLRSSPETSVLTRATRRNIPAECVPTADNLGLLDRSRSTFHSSSSSNYLHETAQNPFQTNYFSEYLSAPRIDPGTSATVARDS
jgi:hypothetical protein